MSFEDSELRSALQDYAGEWVRWQWATCYRSHLIVPVEDLKTRLFHVAIVDPLGLDNYSLHGCGFAVTDSNRKNVIEQLREIGREAVDRAIYEELQNAEYPLEMQKVLRCVGAIAGKLC